MQFKKYTLLLLMLLALLPWTIAQEVVSDSNSRWDYHISLGTGVSTGFGATTVYTAVAPTISYQATDRLQLKAGFAVVNSIDPNHFSSQATSARGMVPRRNSSTAVAASLALNYQVNNNLWVGGSVFHIGGQAILPGGLAFWGIVPGGLTMDMDITGVSAQMHYKFGNGNTLGVYLSYVQDRTGAMLPLLYSPFYYGGPFNHDPAGQSLPTAYGPFVY